MFSSFAKQDIVGVIVWALIRFCFIYLFIESKFGKLVVCRSGSEKVSAGFVKPGLSTS